MSWLFTLEDVYLSSVYLRQEIKGEDRVGFVKGRVSEALRMAGKILRKQQVLPYYWFKYQDNRDNFLSEVSSFEFFEHQILVSRKFIENLSAQKDTENTFNTIVNLGADGLIIWGSSEDTNTEQKCKDLLQYVRTVLGPAIKRIKYNSK